MWCYWLEYLVIDTECAAIGGVCAYLYFEPLQWVAIIGLNLDVLLLVGIPKTCALCTAQRAYQV